MKPICKLVSAILFVFFLFSLNVYAPQEARVLRFPAISNDQIVFSYAGDLYSVGLSGGGARKLTTYEGYASSAIPPR